ncbi:protein PFC0760c [Fagus crenata]
MHSPKLSHTITNQELSLKALKLSPETQKPPFNNMLSSASSWSIGDYIGMESCLDLNDEVHSLESSGVESDSEVYIKKCRGKRDQRLAKMQKEFPPPIPLLARTENLPCHMPWVLKRHYTSDGRLILTEEKVKHHEYFRAHRADGRLTLQLVPLDDDVWLPDHLGDEYCDCNGTNDEEEEEEEEEEEVDNDTEEKEKEREKENDIDNNIDVVDEVKVEVEKEIVHKDRCVIEESTTNGSAGIGGGTNGAGKCLNLNCNNVTSGSSCIFGVSVPAIRI